MQTWRVHMRLLRRSGASSSLRPHGLQPARPLRPWESPGKTTGAGGHALLQGILPTQGSNPHLLHWQLDSLPLSHRGSSMECASARKENETTRTQLERVTPSEEGQTKTNTM